MTYQTYLEYTFAPNPLTEGETQDLIVIATLKQGVGLTSATISQIVLDFGDVGSGATDLTNTAFTLANIQMPVGWTPTVSGVTCTLTPSGSAGLVSTDDALIFTIQGVQVNTAIGNVTLTVSEAATPALQTNGEPPTTTTANPGVETIVLPKLAASEVPFTLRADPESISAGENTTLNWSGGGVNNTYSLLYINCGNLTTITAHKNGTLLSADDVYPNTDLSPQDPGLVLNSSGTFILQATSGNVTTNLTTEVIVSQPDLYANSLSLSGNINNKQNVAYSLNMPYPSGVNNNGLLIGSASNLNGSYGGVTIVCESSSPAYPFAIVTPTGNQAFIIDQSGNATTSGALTVQGDVTINGNVTNSLIVQGNLTVNGNIITSGKGGRNYVATLSSENNYTGKTVFSNNPYKRYEIVFNGIAPTTNGDETFGARLYVQDASLQPTSSNNYQSESYGNDSGGNNAESNTNNYLPLWQSGRTGPSSDGLVGTMTLYAHLSLGYIAHLYGLYAFNSMGCQVWIAGGLNTGHQLPVNGIEFNFYSGGGISGGTIDIYGWN